MSCKSDLSLAVAFQATCPLCGAPIKGRRWRILDADHRPDLVVHACDGSLQRTFCSTCIGPGVEQAGSFCIVRRNGAKLEVINFFARETADFHAAVKSLHAKLRERCQASGVAADAITPMGSSWLHDVGDVNNSVAETWPDFKRTIDAAMLQGPLSALLNATSPTERAEALLAQPDLARPNIESFLSLLAEKEIDQRVAAEAARRFVSTARRIGVPAARTGDETARTARESFAERRPELARLLSVFLATEPNSAVELDQTITIGHALIDALQQVREPGCAAGVWQRIGHLFQHRSKRPDAILLAIDAYQQALAAFPSEQLQTRSLVLLELSACWDTRADGDRSENLEHALACAEAARAASAALPGDEQAEAEMEIGILYTRRLIGDPRANLALAREALDRAVKRASSANLRALARYNFALTYIEDPAEGGSLDAGIGMLQVFTDPEVIALFDAEQQQNLYQSLGAAFARRAVSKPGSDPTNLDSAAQFIARAGQSAKSRGKPFEAAFNACLLAEIEADRRLRGRGDRDLGDILALVDQAGATLTIEAAPFEYARKELTRFRILNDLAEPELARPFLIQALENACRVLTPENAPDLSRRAQSQLGEIHLSAGNYSAAARAFEIACEASDNVYAATESVPGRAEETVPNAQLYAGLVDALARLGTDGEKTSTPDLTWRVLEAMEHGRARLTLDLLGLRPLPPFAGVPQGLLVREAQLLAELAWSVPGATADKYRVSSIDPEWLRRQRATRAALEALWDEIAASGAGGRLHASLRRSRPPNRDALAALANTLGARAAIVSFFVLPDRVLVVLSRSGEVPKVDTVELPEAELRGTWLSEFEHDVLAAEPAHSPTHRWLVLGETLFAPVVDALSDLELLVVIPHGALHALPLHALTVAGQPLIERVPIVYSPSMGVLAAVVDAERADPTHAGALVLSHATNAKEATEFEGEANTVARLLGTQARHHALQTALVTAAPTAGLIHLACHGFFDPNDPLASGVVLADGVMRARDWLPLALRSDLVTLSACETGRQQLREGDELTGLARVLLQSGSTSVLLTLWRVYSSTTVDWMVRFYTALAKPSQNSRAQAFQRATVELRARDPDPRAWAPFVLIGDPGYCPPR